MRHLPDRVHQLLDTLATADQPLSGDEIGRVLGVTARSVRDYVRAVNKHRDEPVVIASHRGYALASGARAGAVPIPSEADSGTQRSRALIILRCLLSSGSRVEVHSLCDLLSISMTTLEVALSRVRDIARERMLVLARDHEWISLEGPEVQQRRLFCEILWPTTEPRRHAGETSRLVDDRPERDLSTIREILQRCLAHHDLDAHDFALDDLTVSIDVAIARTRAGRHLPPAAETPLPPVANALAEDLEHYAGVGLDAAERQGLADLIEANTTSVGVNPAVALPAEVVQAVESALTQIADDFDLSRIGADRVDKLYLHVNALRKRARTGALVHNPLSRPFQESQPLLHELGVQFARKLENELDIALDDSEVGFLAFYLANHFAVDRSAETPIVVQFVVPRYAPLLEGFQNAVTRAVGDLGYVGPPLSVEEVKADAFDSDVVVTCVHLAQIPNVRTVVVSPVPTEDDVAAIRNAISSVAEERRRNHMWGILSDLIQPDHFFTDTGWTRRDEVIRELASVLIERGYAPESFTDDVLHRERLSPTAFRDQFAIPTACNCPHIARGSPYTSDPVRFPGERVRCSS